MFASFPSTSPSASTCSGKICLSVHMQNTSAASRAFMGYGGFPECIHGRLCSAFQRRPVMMVNRKFAKCLTFKQWTWCYKYCSEHIWKTRDCEHNTTSVPFIGPPSFDIKRESSAANARNTQIPQLLVQITIPQCSILMVSLHHELRRYEDNNQRLF